MATMADALIKARRTVHIVVEGFVCFESGGWSRVDALLKWPEALAKWKRLVEPSQLVFKGGLNGQSFAYTDAPSKRSGKPIDDVVADIQRHPDVIT